MFSEYPAHFLVTPVGGGTHSRDAMQTINNEVRKLYSSIGFTPHEVNGIDYVSNCAVSPNSNCFLPLHTCHEVDGKSIVLSRFVRYQKDSL